MGRASISAGLKEDIKDLEERVKNLRDTLEAVQYDLPPDLVVFVQRRLDDDLAEANCQ